MLAGGGNAITVGDALLMIGGDTEEAQKALSELKESSERSMMGMAQQAGKVMTAMGAAITGTITGAIVHWMRAGDELDKMSDRVNWSVESLSAFRFVTSQTGTDMNTFERAVRNSQQRVDEFVQSGGNADHALGQLGLTAQDFAGLNMEEQFYTIVGALENLEEQERRNVISADIFGRRAGPELANMLNLGSEGLRELQKRGFEVQGMTTESASSAAAFADSLDELKQSFAPLMVAIAEAVQGPLKDLIDSASEWVQSASKWIGENEELFASIVKFVGAIGAAMTVLGPFLIMLPGIIAAVKGIAAAFAFVAAGISAPVLAIVAAVAGVIAIGVALYKNWDTVKEKFLAIWDGIKSGLSGAWDAIKEVFVGSLILIQEAWTNTWESIGNAFSAVWEGIKAIFGWIIDGIVAVIGGIWELGKSAAGLMGFGGGGGAPQQVPAFASGGVMGRTGPAILGEQGAELVLSPTMARLQGGAQVVNAEDTAKLLGGGGVNLSVNVGEMHVREEADIHRISRELYDISRRELEAKGHAY